MRWLVTGASGFIGWHLVSHLSESGHDVAAWIRGGDDPWPGRSIRRAAVDITDKAAVAAGMSEALPDVTVHLAAQSLPMRSWEQPAETVRINIEGTLHLLDAVHGLKKPHRLLLAGSSSQYGAAKNSGPIREDAPMVPDSPYAASKQAAEIFADLYGRAHGLDVVHFRPFSWIGTRKKGDVSSDLARRIVAIERGGRPVLKVGRTDVVRDMIDVRDGVRALVLLSQKGVVGGIYNICSGAGTDIAALLQHLRAASGHEFSLETDPALARPIDADVRVGDATRIRGLGWSPEIPLPLSVRAILDYWRQQ